MAEFLIKARDQQDLPADAEKRDRGWKRGDIVVVMPDGHEWGREERLPKFVVVQIPGVPVENALKYLTPYQVDTGLVDQSGMPILRLVARRKYRLLVDSIPAAIKTALLRDGMVSVSWANIKSYIQNKETLTTE